MNCQRIDEILDGHRQAALGAAERSEVDQHLDSCQRCSDAWLSHEALAGDDVPGPRAGLFDEIADQATQHRPEAPRAAASGRRTAYIAVAATATLAAITVFWLSGEDSVSGGSQTAAVESAVPSATARPGDVPVTAPFPLPASRYVAGRDYEQLVVPAPTSVEAGVIEVCEFFMFPCRHCWEFEPALNAWNEAQPDYVRLVRVPVLFNATARLHAQAWYTAEALGRLDTIREPFYEAIHVRGQTLATVAEVRAFFVSQGVAAQDFDEAFDSFAVRAQLGRAEELNRLYRVTATPSMGVNGRYLTNAGLTGSNEVMLDVVDELVASEARGLCSGGDDARCPLE